MLQSTSTGFIAEMSGGIHRSPQPSHARSRLETVRGHQVGLVERQRATLRSGGRALITVKGHKSGLQILPLKE